MPPRALHLFPLLNAAELNLTSSFFTLRIAASREWSRRTIAHSHTKIPAQQVHRTTRGKQSIKSGPSILTPGPSRMAGATSAISCNTPRDAKIAVNPTEQEQCIDILERTNCADVVTNYEGPDIIRTVTGCADFDPELNNYEPTHTDLFYEEPPIRDYLENLSSEDLSSCLTTVNVNIEVSPHLPIPTSPDLLYENFIHVLRTRIPRPTLAALVDYHRLFPDHQSTRSYNLLISLSLHHRAYGITRALFHAMRDRSIQRNIETHRLYVSSLIYQGFWDKAWSYATELAKKIPGGSIPFSIWLEFCHTRKGPMILEKDQKGKKKRLQNVSEPVALMSARRKVMNLNRPLAIPPLKDTPPVGMRNMVQLMVKSRLRHQALKLTEDYFKALPLNMNGMMNHQCLNIVKIHLAHKGSGKTGIPRFNAAKKLLFSLLSFNPSLRPTSDVLLFILGILKKAKRSGTVAYDFISLCKEKWGPGVEDRRVQRRVSRLALKEGRMDIVETMLRAEASDNFYRRPRLLEQEVVGDFLRPSPKTFRRPWTRGIYPRNGRETYMWDRLCLRVRRTIKTRIARGRKITKSLQLLARDRALYPTNSGPQ